MIYTLTAVESPDVRDHLRDKRCWGFYHSERKALQAIAKNYGGMDDCLFTHLVLEEYKPGVIAIAEREVWFEWRNQQWSLCEKPAFSEGLVSWAMG